jgi:dienelactone hydrolase
MSLQLQQTNIARVKRLVAEFQAGRPEGYLAGVHDDIKGSVLGGLIPGGENYNGKAAFTKLMEEMPRYMEVSRFEPCNWRAVGDDVLFNVNWKFKWLATGKEIETTALVRKVVREGMICEKYHMVDTTVVTGEASPHDTSTVSRVQELLVHIAAGQPEGYMAGVADDVKASMLGGLIPDAEAITNKNDFAAVMGKMGQYMEVRSFEPYNFMALPNGDMMFNVSWKFKWLATGKEVETTAIVRKVLNADGMICEKYHMMDVDAVLQDSPRDVIGAAENTCEQTTAKERACTTSGFEDTTFATFTPATKVDAALPVLLFQSGYGSTSVGHQPLMQHIADAGYVCVIPDRESDTKGGKESVGKVFAGLAEGKPASEHNAMSTDGTHLAEALAWIKQRTSIDGQLIDSAKTAAAGFSMGCIEAIMFAAACAADVKALAIISSSSGKALEKLYCFEQSDLARKCADLGCPSLWITSDLDSQKGATTELFEVAASPAQLLVFKDAALDNSMALTDETSIWSPAVNEMLPGLAQHFALACERGVVTDAPIIAFLDHHLKGAAAAPLAEEAAITEQTAK